MNTASLAGAAARPCAPPPSPAPRFRRLEALGANACHWPTVEDAEGVQLFCGCRRTAGAVYCAGHQGRAYRRPRVWEQRILEPAAKAPPKPGLGWDRFGDR